MNRFSAGQRWDDIQALEQAIWVANDQVGEYDLNEIGQWAEREGEPEKFKTFSARLNAALL